MSFRIKLFILFFSAFFTFIFSQIVEERLILEKKREPEVKKIEKKQSIIDAGTGKRIKKDSAHLKYTVVDIPVSSDFEASTIKGADISPSFKEDYKRNYFGMGYGNYNQLLVDGNVSSAIDQTWEIGANLHHKSTSGLKELYPWDSNKSVSALSTYLNNYGDNGKLNLNIDYVRQLYNYYGVYALPVTANTDLGQRTHRFSLMGSYENYAESMFKKVNVKSYFLGDRFSAAEGKAEVSADFGKRELYSFGDNLHLSADLNLDLEYQNTSFGILDKNTSKFLNVSAVPKLTLRRGASYVSLGMNGYFLNSQNNSASGVDDKVNRVYWYPKAEIFYSLSPMINLFVGLGGGIKLNSYSQILVQNPYLIANQYIKPTETKYSIYFGIKGDIQPDLKYSFSSSVSKVKNIMFLKGNDLLDRNAPYAYANTFSAVYDNGTVSGIKGNLQYFPTSRLTIDTELNYNHYALNNYERIYNVPLVNASIGARYTLINKKLLLGFKGYFVGSRNTNLYALRGGNIGETIAPPSLVRQENKNARINRYADINLSVEYKIHDNFSIFALGNNLFNSNYQEFIGYRVMGAQIMGGATISF
ncbi:MAG: TonB-dependent receptor [Bergeyella sp.]|nr:TonB-dependent receptor [Bergeyella sp.]